MKDQRIPSDLISAGLDELVAFGSLDHWDGPSFAIGNNRRSWHVIYIDGIEDWLTVGEAWCLVRGARDLAKTMMVSL